MGITLANGSGNGYFMAGQSDGNRVNYRVPGFSAINSSGSDHNQGRVMMDMHFSITPTSNQGILLAGDWWSTTTWAPNGWPGATDTTFDMTGAITVAIIAPNNVFANILKCEYAIY